MTIMEVQEKYTQDDYIESLDVDEMAEILRKNWNSDLEKGYQSYIAEMWDIETEHSRGSYEL